MALDSRLARVPLEAPIVEAGGKISGVWLRWLNALKDRAEFVGSSGATVDASQIISGILALARISGLTDAQIAAGAAIAWSKLSKVGSSLADLETRSAGDLASGTLPDGRFPATLPAASGANLTALNASNISAGTLADARLSSKVPLDDVAEAIAGVWDFSNGLKERGRSAKILEWTDVAYSAGNFTGNGSMTWTVASGDQVTYKYALAGSTMFLAVVIQTSSVGGTPSDRLKVAIPGGFTAKGGAFFPYQGIDTADATPAILSVCEVTNGGSVVDCFRDVNASNWPASTDTTHVRFSIAFEVQ
jgi:hypothetical protein